MKKNIKWGINKKVLSSIVAFTILFTVLICLGGSLIFMRSVQKIYNEHGYVIASIILNKIDHDKIAEYTRTWEADEYYDELSEYLKEIQEQSSVAYIYITVPREDRTMKHVYDSGYYDYYASGTSFGFVDPIAASFEEIWASYKNGERPKSFLVRRSQYGYLTSSCLPIRDSEGTVVALLFVDTNMEVIESTIKRFVLNMSLIALVLLALFCQMNWHYVHKNIISPLLAIRKSVKSFAQDTETFDYSLEKIRTNDELEELAEAVGGMERKIVENIKSIKAITAEKERIGAELSLAAKIQGDMLNKDYPPFPERTDFDLFATMDAAKEVGGDLYDYLLLDTDHLLMFVGDVSGKGVPAALFMAKCKVLLDLYAMLGLSPKEIFERANDQLCKGNDSDLFVTAWLGIFTFSTGELKFVNAGHPFPVLYKKEEDEFSYLKTKPNFVLGGMKGLPYAEHSVSLKKGDRIFVYTDGVTEATDSKNELFGDDRLLEAMKGTKSKTAPETLTSIRTSIDTFVGAVEQFDDITMMTFEWRGKN